ncbi:hypothetical protein [Kitasatospora sp. NPDC059673]|uniref:hypothetical protein n=1 Tax=Kitasatospora sp. NPDC059673 TaxID=3346901 RepID=UPI0036C12665
MLLLLGLLLFAASGAFAGLLIADNLGGGPETGVTVLGQHIATISTLGAFLAGIALTLIFCAGLLLIRSGLHRRHRYVRTAAAGGPVTVGRTAGPPSSGTADPLGTGTATRPPARSDRAAVSPTDHREKGHPHE